MAIHFPIEVGHSDYPHQVAVTNKADSESGVILSEWSQPRLKDCSNNKPQ